MGISLRVLPSKDIKDKNAQEEWPETQEINIEEEAHIDSVNKSVTAA